MIGHEQFDHLLNDCLTAWGRLSEGERRDLVRLCHRRERLGCTIHKHVAADEVEFLEDCASRDGCDRRR